MMENRDRIDIKDEIRKRYGTVRRVSYNFV